MITVVYKCVSLKALVKHSNLKNTNRDMANSTTHSKLH